MRTLFLSLAVLILSACGSKNSTLASLPDSVAKTGVIIAKELVPVEEAESSSVKVRHSIFASIFSGGRISLGLGFLFTSDDNGHSTETHVRYAIKMLDGSEMVIYSRSQSFQIGDCVETLIHEDVDNHPPKIKRAEGGCES